MGWGLRGILGILPSPTVVPRPAIQRTLADLTAKDRVLDLGAGGRRIAPGVVTFDAVAGPEVDVVGDIHQLPFDDGSFDCIFCTGTLEHVQDPWQAVREMHRVLRGGGLVHIDVPFIQGYHADPTDYWRFTRDGLRLLTKQFQEIECDVHIGPTCGLIWIARQWSDSFFENRWLSNLFLIATAIVTAPFKYLDYWLINKAKAHYVASAVYFRGRKTVVSVE